MISLSGSGVAAGPDVPAGPDAPAHAAGNDRFVDASSISLASRAARGTIVNAGFLAAINVFGLVKGLAAASFLGAAAYGVWGLIGVTASLILSLGAVGVDDKYIQQDKADQEAAFQTAFTLQCGLVLMVALGILVAMPVFSWVYGKPEIIAPGMTLALCMPAAALSTPLWVFWRRMDFVRQRKLQIWDPVVSLVVVVALAAAGLGVWALVLGTMAGNYAAALAAVRASPYPLRLRFDRGALREYASFSWPLFVGSLSAVMIALIPAIVASRALGLAAVGAIALSNTIVQFVYRVDEVITQVLYPAVCAVKDQADVLFAAFWKSNRLALLWALPCGAAGALFAADFVHYVLGEKWRIAVTLIEVLAVTAAINQVGFNWTAFYRALGRTRPIAVANVVLLAGVVGIAAPLLVRDGLDGYAAGMAAATAGLIAVRLFFLARLFPPARLALHLGRAFLPVIPPVVAVVAIRIASGPGRSGAQAIAEISVFVATTLVGTVIAERDLLREMLGYLREGARPGGVTL